MKLKLLFCAALLGVAVVGNGQTNTFPASGNVGIGTTTPATTLQVGKLGSNNNSISLPGDYNFENVYLGQLGNGNAGLEFVNHTNLSSSYGAKMLTNIDSYGANLVFMMAPPVTSYSALSYSPVLSLSTGGNVGIGTTNPTGLLDVRGSNQRISIGDGTNQLTFGQWDAINNRIESANRPLLITTYTGNINLGPSGTSSLSISTNGNVGIGTNSPNRTLDVAGISRTTHTEFYEGSVCYGFIGRGSSYTGGWAATPDALTLTYALRDFAIGGWAKNGTGWKGASLYINSDNGNVGIGTTSPQNKLDVNGTIHAKEVKVDLTGWSDFVFAPTYKLKPLTEVEQYIIANNHLPEIPSANEVAQNGVSLGDMQAKLLQKVEELTLYTIEQNKAKVEQDKQLQEQQQVNVVLQQQLTAQAKEIEELKQLIKEKLK